jgi:hypothetical protein
MSHFFIHERGRHRPIHFWSVLGVWKSINLTVVQMFFIDRNCNLLPLRYCIDFFSVNGNFLAFLILILQSNTYFIKRKLHYKLALDTELCPSGPITGMRSYVQQIRCVSEISLYGCMKWFEVDVSLNHDVIASFPLLK